MARHEALAVSVSARAARATKPASPDKAELVREVRARLERDLGVLQKAARDASEGATHEENRAEGDKDMRATEESYRARGQWQRVLDVEAEVAALAALRLRAFGDDEPIALGALVTVVEGDDELESRVLVLPAGGGARVASGGIEVQVVTPRAPLGAALVGRRVGDDVVVTAAGRARELSITRVA